MIERQLDPGTPVFDAAGKRVGIVGLNNPYEGYLVVQKGLLFPHEVYLPLDAVDGNADDGIYLRVHRHELREARYRMPPSDATAAAHDIEEYAV